MSAKVRRSKSKKRLKACTGMYRHVQACETEAMGSRRAVNRHLSSWGRRDAQWSGNVWLLQRSQIQQSCRVAHSDV